MIEPFYAVAQHAPCHWKQGSFPGGAGPNVGNAWRAPVTAISLLIDCVWQLRGIHLFGDIFQTGMRDIESGPLRRSKTISASGIFFIVVVDQVHDPVMLAGWWPP